MGVAFCIPWKEGPGERKGIFRPFGGTGLGAREITAIMSDKALLERERSLLDSTRS
jgi:hypothetical protein